MSRSSYTDGDDDTENEVDDGNCRILRGPRSPADYMAMLECPVCYELLLPPIYPCIHGHNICKRCRERVTGCPICRSDMSECRNIFLENLLDYCWLSCKYNPMGCKNHYHGGDMLGHEAECDYRPIFCLWCNHLVRYDEYLQHLNKEKQVQIVGEAGYRSAFDMDEDSLERACHHIWHSAWLKYCDNDFFLHMDSDGKVWWIFLSVFGPKEIAKDWNCELIVFNAEKNVSVSYNGPVNPFRNHGSDAEKLGYCLSLTRSTVKFFVRSASLEVAVKIFRGGSTALERQSPLPARGGMCLSSGGSHAEPQVTNNNQQPGSPSDVVYQNVAIPMFAVVSHVSSDSSPNSSDSQDHGSSSGDSTNTSPEQPRTNNAIGNHTAAGSQTDDDVRGSRRDSMGYIIGERLSSFTRSFSDPAGREPLVSPPEVNFYNSQMPYPVVSIPRIEPGPRSILPRPARFDRIISGVVLDHQNASTNFPPNQVLNTRLEGPPSVDARYNTPPPRMPLRFPAPIQFPNPPQNPRHRFPPPPSPGQQNLRPFSPSNAPLPQGG